MAENGRRQIHPSRREKEMNKVLPLLAMLAAVPASSGEFKDCLKMSSGAISGGQTLDDLRDCQELARGQFQEKKAKKGLEPTAAELDRLDEHQREEARRLMAASKEVIVGPGASSTEADFGSKKGARSALKDGEALPAGSTPGKLGGVTAENLSRTDPKSAKDIQDLQNRLHAAAGDGKDGVTPAMADDVRRTLESAQGSVSPDMKQLLEATSKDGGKLTPETMKLLQKAGKSAKDGGMNLNIDPSTEKELLEHDFDQDKSAQPPGNL